MGNITELAKQLISRPSITPDDADCQEILINRLQKIGFQIESLPFNNVSNFWARRGTEGPVLAFLGHTDVVPPGPLEQWQTHPFEPEIRDGFLYGRGAADMKGSIAAMLVACEKFIAQYPNQKGSIAWLITSDEEGASIDGTKKVIEVLEKRHEKINYCLVGEASCDQQLGDTIKIGRRGTLSGKLIIHGKQGHVAYPQRAENPIHKVAEFLAEFVKIEWDKGNEYFPPTSLQISNIHAGTGVGNVIPGELEIQFNFRYSPEVTADLLQQRVLELLEKYPLKFSIEWQHSGQAFLTKPGELVEACSKAIQETVNVIPILSTSGGTSDGRFVAPTGAQVVELGPSNRTIHQINECVAVEELNKLSEIYQRVLEKLLI